MIAIRVAMITSDKRELKDRKYLNNKLIFILPILAVLLFVSFEGINPALASQLDPSVLAKVNLPFIENNGQLNPDVKYYANTFAGSVFVTNNGLTYSIVKDSDGVAVKERFLTIPSLQITGTEKSQSVVNYFVGSKENWRSNIPTYNTVDLGQVFPSVDVEIRAYGKNIEKIFKVAPDGSVGNIRLGFDGIQSLTVGENGELLIGTEYGTVAMTKPLAFQDVNGIKNSVDVSYFVDGNTYGFGVGDYDPQYTLVIDPLLASTFIGGNATDIPTSIAVDGSGDVFVAGNAAFSYPTTGGAYDTTYNGGVSDVFVSKLDSSLSTLVASTYIGGNSSETAEDISIGGVLGHVFVTGETSSSDFPTTGGAYQTTYNGGLRDGFVSKLDNSLSTLVASTFLGGSNNEFSLGMSLNGTDSVFVTGATVSSDFPTTGGAYDTTWAGGFFDVFVSKLDNSLSTLEASTFIGSIQPDVGRAIVVSGPAVYVTGETDSVNSSNSYPTTGGAYQTTYGGVSDAFVSMLDGALSTLVASTYLGGSLSEDGNAIVISGSDVFVTGSSNSADFPTTGGAYDTSHNGGGTLDVFVSKLDSSLSTLAASTFIGGTGNEVGEDMSIPLTGDVFVTGSTSSSDFPTTGGAYDTTYNGVSDAFVSKLDSSLSTLAASTFLGGSVIESGNGIALNGSAYVFVTGNTNSFNYPTTVGAYDTTYNGGNDVFVSKLTSDLASAASTVPAAPTGLTASAVSSSQINLSWTASADGGSPITGYKIERESPVGGGFATVNATTGTNATTYSDTGLVAGTEYNYKVSAINAVGTGPASNEASSVTFKITLGLNQTSVKWDYPVRANGTLVGAILLSNDTVSVNWDDGTALTVVPVNTDLVSWGPVVHSYAAGTVGTRNVVATLERNPILATSSIASVTVTKHTTLTTLGTIPDQSANTPFAGVGRVNDTDATGPRTGNMTGLSVTFTGNGSTPLPSPVLTGDIRFTGAAGSVATCGTCSPSGVKVLYLPDGAKIVFPPGTVAVNMEIQDVGTSTFDFKVNQTNGETSTERLAGAGINIAIFNILASSGAFIQDIEVDNIVGTAPAVGITKIEITDPVLAPETVLTTDLQSLPVGAITRINPLDLGAFKSKGTVQSTVPASPLVMQANFAGNADLLPSTSPTVSYGVYTSTVSGLGGILQDQTVDSPTTFTSTACAAGNDNDGDKICNDWETAGIPYVNGLGATVYYGLPTTQHPIYGSIGPNPDHKNVYVEIDAMVGHTPDTNAINDVITVFEPSPRTNNPVTNPDSNNGIRLNVVVDDLTIPHEHSLNVWTDTILDINRNNDTGSIKADFFGNSTERSRITGLAVSNLAGPGNSENATFTGMILTTPDAAKGNILIKQKITYGGAATTITVQEAITTLGSCPNVSLDIAGITKTWSPSATTAATERVLTLKIPFTTAAAVSGTSVCDIKVPYTLSANRTPSQVVFSGTPAAPQVITTRIQAKAQVFHYGIWAHTIGGGICGPSGIAELKGNDFVVSLGCNFTNTEGGYNDGRANTIETVGSRVEQAGTFMHELGHNLNLKHGGPAALVGGGAVPDVDENCKPNYRSVMSYSSQIPAYLGQGVVDAQGRPLLWYLDYSRDIFPDLLETSLVEGEGLESINDFAPVIVYGDPDPTPAIQPVRTASSTALSALAPSTNLDIDWDGDGNTAETSSADINNLGIGGCGASLVTRTIKDYNDWLNFDYNFRGNTGALFDAQNPVQRSPITSTIIADALSDINQYSGFLTGNLKRDGTSLFERGELIITTFKITDDDGKIVKNLKTKLKLITNAGVVKKEVSCIFVPVLNIYSCLLIIPTSTPLGTNFIDLTVIQGTQQTKLTDPVHRFADGNGGSHTGKITLVLDND